VVGRSSGNKAPKMCNEEEDNNTVPFRSPGWEKWQQKHIVQVAAAATVRAFSSWVEEKQQISHKEVSQFFGSCFLLLLPTTNKKKLHN